MTDGAVIMRAPPGRRAAGNRLVTPASSVAQHVLDRPPRRRPRMSKALMAWILVAAAVAEPIASPREVVQSAVDRVVASIQRTERHAADPLPGRRLVRAQGRIESYSGEKIIYLGEAVDVPFATVRSKVVTRRNLETPLDYRLHLREGRWKVYDVLIDHVSFVATYRSEFSRLLQREPYAAVVERLRKQSTDAAALIRTPRGY